MEDIELERIMFTKPPEWGRRIIKRDNEILLQTTGDAGETWKDMPISEVRLIIPESNLRSTSDNPYEGIIFEDRMQTRSIDTADSNDTNSVVAQDILDSVASGKLLSVSVDDKGIETISFLSAYAVSGLQPGQVWRDDKNYLRIVPPWK